MRVLCITTDYPPYGSGGYERQCRDTNEHLRDHGHRVLVLSGQVHGTAPARDGVHRLLPRFPVDPRRIAADEASRAERRSAASLERTIAAFRPHVACLWRLGELSMSLPARLSTSGIPAVGMVCDSWMIEGPRRDPWARRTRRPPGGARWLFVSRALREQVAGSGLPVAGAEIVPAGIELGAWPLAPPRPWRGRLLYAVRLSPLKGVDLALRALERLPSGVTLDIAGDGHAGYASHLTHVAAAPLLRGRVRFHGTVTRAALASMYGAVDALLFPVRWPEPFGLVPLEAMACGTPVIAVASGGAAGYLRHGHNALLVPRDDSAAIAAAATRLAGDAALRERLRAGGRRTAALHPASIGQTRIRLALEHERVSRL